MTGDRLEAGRGRPTIEAADLTALPSEERSGFAVDPESYEEMLRLERRFHESRQRLESLLSRIAEENSSNRRNRHNRRNRCDSSDRDARSDSSLSDDSSLLEDSSDRDLVPDGGSAPLEDVDVVCISCGSEAVERLELPGGRIVRPDAVPFGTAVAGVTSVRVCPLSGDVLVRDRSSEGRA